MKVILMHGKNTDPTGKWYPWFAAEMEDEGIEYTAPKLPKADNPVLSEWLSKLSDADPDSETILVGHSRGGVAILRWLEKAPEDLVVKKVILLATNSGFIKKMAVPPETNYGFYTENGYNFDKIKKHSNDFVVLHSKDDHWVPYEAGIENARGLDAKFISLEDYQHFGTGVDKIPELLEEI